MTLTLALPIWLGRIVWSVGYQANRLLAHLVPSGTPGPLIPVIVIIETVRNVIRPHAICAIRGKHNGRTPTFNSVRLAGPECRPILLAGLILALILLLLLELGVACIQAYVFTILSSLYLNELSSLAFNKTITK